VAEATATGPTVARYGFFPVVVGDDVSVRQAGTTLVAASANLDLHQGGTQLAVAGGDVTISQGGAQALLAGGAVQIHQGGAGIVLTPEVTASESFVGVVLAGSANLESSKVLLTTPQAAALGAALGLVCVGLGRLLRER
jgi:hypothetical protein